ncbi:MAG: thioredoxin family protein [Verrucomicrobiales bacterium]|nr:thioredoxin family protein [Verrucomicrobiales bacterium]
MGRFLILCALGALLLSIIKGGRGGGEVDFPMIQINQVTPTSLQPENKKIRVVLFTGTEWCGACQHLDSTVIGTAAWQDFAKKELRFRVVDIPADRSKASQSDLRLAQQFGVRGYPTMVVMDAQNEELSRQVGSGAPVENYKAWIRKHSQFY